MLSLFQTFCLKCNIVLRLLVKHYNSVDIINKQPMASDAQLAAHDL